VLLHNEQGTTALHSIESDLRSNGDEDSTKSSSSTLWHTKHDEVEVKAMALSHDEQQVAIAHDQAVEMWSVGAQEQLPIWSTAMPLTSATAIAFHPDGRRVAVVDGWSGRVVLLDAVTGQVLLELNARSGTDRAKVAFSTDGNRLIATVGGELYVWSAADQHAELGNASVTTPSKSQCQTKFQWHVNQASEQIYGGLPSGAEFHARRALEVYAHYQDKLRGMPALEVLELNAKCHLAKALIDLGQQQLGKEMLETIIAECPNQYRSLHTISLLLATYPGQNSVSPAQLVGLANRALKLEPTDSNAVATAGIAYLRTGDLDQSRRLLANAANTMSSWDGLALFPLAVIEARSESPDEAGRIFARGLEWMESAGSKQPIIRELHRWAAEEMNR
jgi:tetratricopeptide (TPR) repeat protein